MCKKNFFGCLCPTLAGNVGFILRLILEEQKGRHSGGEINKVVQSRKMGNWDIFYASGVGC